MAEYLGSLIVEQGQQWGWDAQSGQTLIRTWKGHKDWATSYFNSLQNQSGVLRSRLSPDGDGATYVVTAEYGQIQTQAETDGSIPYFWELAGNMIDKSVYDNPVFDALDYSEKSDVRATFEDKISGTELTTAYNAWNELQKFLYVELIQGNENYQVSSYALRISRTFSSLYSNTIPSTDVEKRYTYAQIQAEASSISSPISTAIDSNIPTGGAWLKQAPVLTELSNRKLQLSQEWWWSDKWSEVLYEAKT